MMANYFVTRGFCLTFVTLLLTTFFTASNANWYGKRGEKVDNSLYSLLQGTLPDIMDRQLDAQMTLRAIGKLIQDYELRQLQSVDGKGGAK